MGWAEDITQLLADLNDISVRYDIEQDLTDTEQGRARSNIDIGASAASLGDGDYKITIQ